MTNEPYEISQNGFCIQLETKKAQAKISFFNFRKFFQSFFRIRDFQMTQYGYQMKLEEILRLTAEK